MSRLSSNSLLYLYILAVGLLAQLVDGAIGMGYGVVSNSMLLTMGLTPAVSSMIIHASEVFTTSASGLSHLKYGNIDKSLFIRLSIPGSIAAVVGAYILSTLEIPMLRRLVALYLGIMGGVMLLRSANIVLFMKRMNIPVLAAVGGLFDAMGGGGWGPIVTSTLAATSRYKVNKIIGSVNAAEFFISVPQTITFILLLDQSYLILAAPLIIGGLITAPVGAYLCRRTKSKLIMIAAGCAVIILALRNLLY